MIILVNPRATRPANRRFPLSVMAVGAALPAEMDWEIVDGNLPGADVVADLAAAGRVKAIFLDIVKGDVIEIEDRLCHGGLTSPRPFRPRA